jgi:hypothetical protein
MEAFKVHVTFSNDDTMIEDHNESTLESALTRLLRGPAAMGGLISEVKVVDMLDCTVFLAQDNKIVFPSPKASLH